MRNALPRTIYGKVQDRASFQAVTVGRYVIHEPIASGGMATVHFAQQLGPHGFARTVAVKRLLPGLASDPELSRALMDEARMVSRVTHPNVVPVLDVVSEGGELLLVLEYVHGETLSRLLRAGEGAAIPPRVVASIFVGVLHGLHAAHEATDAAGRALELVHRDISPQNILVGADGIARVLDFGIALALGRSQVTREGQVKGKLAYMAPEQLYGEMVTRRSDVFSTAAVLWETLTRSRLFLGKTDMETMARVSTVQVPAPSQMVDDVPPGLDAIVLKGLEREPARRFGTAREMALAIELAIELASPSQVGAWVERTAIDTLEERSRIVTRIEQGAAPAAAPALAAVPRGSYVMPLLVILALSLGAVMWITRDKHGQASPTYSPAMPVSAPKAEQPTSVKAAASDALPAPPTVSNNASTEPARTATRTKRALKPAHHPAARRGRCEPPYTVDAAGHKQFRIECL